MKRNARLQDMSPAKAITMLTLKNVMGKNYDAENPKDCQRVIRFLFRELERLWARMEECEAPAGRAKTAQGAGKDSPKKNGDRAVLEYFFRIAQCCERASLLTDEELIEAVCGKVLSTFDANTEEESLLSEMVSRFTKKHAGRQPSKSKKRPQTGKIVHRVRREHQ